ncbi:TIGR02677 family protein [Amycolatopsis sp. YIM 10]|uniref:TIGR02677 family protein n=1 Tax=Amycolatopsis sp. YIM 10 TaxID=2653857 RepID=UPI0012A84D16|nr:TIGR02677 family protein [Amycolatopsis sp. YIM 10]QFU86983.1 hypothetical protein YIM_08865 [Amycolatopsis sp. YIM 10]
MEGVHDELALGNVELDESVPVTSPPAADTGLPGRMPEVSYLLSTYAPFYRLVLDILQEEERRLGLHLPTALVAERFTARLTERDATASAPPDVAAMLAQLYVWGNVDRSHNTQRKGTYQEYLRKDYLYQLTPAGAQIHEHLSRIDAELGTAGALQTSLLPEVLAALHDLRTSLSSPAERGSRPRTGVRDVYRALQRVYHAFEPMSGNAKQFIQGLNRALDVGTTLNEEIFLNYKQVVVEYLQTFVLALMRYTEPITTAIIEIETAGLTERFTDIARVEAAPQFGVDFEQVVESDGKQLKEQWHGIRRWFFGDHDRPAVAETLQDRAVDAVNRIVNIVRRLNEQRFHRIDRKADLLTLARWFSGMDDAGQRTRLWREAFGLYSARHLGVPHDPTLGFDVRPRQSWWEGAPAPVDVRVRAQGPRATRGRPQSVPDPRATKARLAARQREQDRAVESAVRLLADRGPMRLSALPALSRVQFQFVLRCLHMALASATHTARSSDGRFEVRLAGAETPTVVVLHTEDGQLSSVDYELTVHDLRSERT